VLLLRDVFTLEISSSSTSVEQWQREAFRLTVRYALGSRLGPSFQVRQDMKYPRLGLIRIEAFDHFLSDAYEQMR
jgi:hypothetical protein